MCIADIGLSETEVQAMAEEKAHNRNYNRTRPISRRFQYRLQSTENQLLACGENGQALCVCVVLQRENAHCTGHVFLAKYHYFKIQDI
jgi:hypothetical protein